MRFWNRRFGDRGEIPAPAPRSPPSLHDEARRLGSLLGEIFDEIEPLISAGISTRALDARVQAAMNARGVTSSFRQLDFDGCCTTSIDDQVINAPPSAHRLEDGQLLKLQIGIKGQTTYATQGWTYAIGPCGDEARRLMTAGYEALQRAVAATTAGDRVGAISAAIQHRIEADGFQVNRNFIGHGINTSMHADPQIPGFGRPEHGAHMKAGHIYSLNVIAHAGAFPCEVQEDDWTLVSKDGGLSVHYGQMLIVGAPSEVLTVERRR